MNTFSHILIGKLLYTYLNREYGIRLDRKYFVRGNYSPDFSVGLLLRPHYMKYKLGFVEREIEALSDLRLDSAEIGREPSKRLGILCHYLADFFCLAHSEGFDRNMIVHVAYERRLHRFLASRRTALSSIRYLPEAGDRIPPGKLSARLGEYHADYLRASRSMGNDIVFSIQVCAEILVSLIRFSPEHLIHSESHTDSK
jgi:hypothetical protein